MKQIEQAPGTRNEYAGANVQTVDKDSDFPANLPYRQRIIYELLLDGVPRSAADITIALRVSTLGVQYVICVSVGLPYRTSGSPVSMAVDLNGILFGEEVCNDRSVTTAKRKIWRRFHRPAYNRYKTGRTTDKNCTTCARLLSLPLYKRLYNRCQKHENT